MKEPWMNPCKKKQPTERPGVTKFDNKCHDIFRAVNDGTDYLARRSGVKCRRCGHDLKAYYCESTLYVVECTHCEVKALTMSRSAYEAACKTLGETDNPSVSLREPAPFTQGSLGTEDTENGNDK